MKAIKAIEVGQTGGQSFSLPADIQTVTTAVLGIRGTGKTNTAGVITEGLLRDGRQVVIVDPTDAWWGLKAARDGRHEGLGILVIGGEHGDIPLTEHDGATIADFLVEERVSAVLSVRHMRKGQFRRLVMDFVEQLFYLKGRPQHRTPLLLVIDECDQFVPQKVGAAEARMVGAVEDVVRRGRNAGLGCMLISQRAASVNKDVLTQLELLIAHRHTSPQDRKALLEWVQAHDAEGRQREFLESLAMLARGEAWFWSPGWLDVFQRVRVHLRETFDSSRTPDGQAVRAPKKLAEVDLQKIKGRLAAQIERAKADDPRELKRRIAELERQLRERPAPDGRCCVEAQAERDKYWRALLGPLSDQCHKAALELARLLERTEPAADTSAPPVVIPQFSVAPTPATARPRPRAAAGPLKGPQQRLLDAIAWWRSVGVEAPTRAMIGFVAGISPTGGHFSNSIGPLSTGGYIVSHGDGVTLTRSGAALASAPDAPPTLAAYHDSIREILKTGAQRRILDAIIAAGPDGCDVAHIGHATGIDPAGGHFSNSIGPLGTLGLIERRKGMVIPTRLLFPSGLR